MKYLFVLVFLPLSLMASEPTLVVQLRKGEVVPFSFNLKSPLFELTTHDPLFCLKSQDDMWMKLEEGKVFFSTDGVIWQDWESALEGKVAFSLHMKASTPQGEVDIELKEVHEDPSSP